MIEFLVYFLGYLFIFKAIDLGRVDSEKYGFLTKIGFTQWLMVMAGVTLLEWGFKM